MHINLSGFRTCWLALLICTYLQTMADKTIYVLADIHVMAPSLLDSSDNEAWQADLANHRKMQELSVPVFDQLVEEIIAKKPDLLLIIGDMTKDGEHESHEYVINKLTKIKEAGIGVYVIPGNHDRGWMEEARRYSNNTYIKIDSYWDNDFPEAYHDFGYGENSELHDGSLSYATQLFPGLTLIGIDTGNMAQVDESTIDWVGRKASEARARGDQTIVMAHHSLIPHFYGQESFMMYSVINTNEQLRDRLMEAGVKAVFTGHYHISDNTRYVNSEGQEIYDIATGSPIAYPCDYRVLTFDDNFRQLKITTESIKTLDGYDNFPQYARNRLQKAFLRWAEDWLIEQSIHERVASFLSESVADIFIIHAEGNEPQNPASPEAVVLYDDILFFSKFIEEEESAEKLNEFSLTMKSMLGDYPSAEEQDNIVNDRSLTITLPTLPTAITGIQESGQASSHWYTLQGMRLSGKPTRPGLYIHNGKRIKYDGKKIIK